MFIHIEKCTETQKGSVEKMVVEDVGKRTECGIYVPASMNERCE